MHKTLVMTLLVWLGYSVNAGAEMPDFVEPTQMVGEGSYRYLFWKIYDAQLYAPSGEFETESPFGLKLVYSRKISGSDIVDQSVDLIRRQGVDDEIVLADWHEQLSAILPDVERGTTLLGVNLNDEGMQFFRDEVLLGQISDTKLCQYFFNIWLAEDSIAPKLRSRLLGLRSRR